MATIYASQQVGVSDGTLVPANKADGREVNANKRSFLATKVTGTTWNIGDTIVLGRKRANEKIAAIQLTTDTTLGTATLDIGIAGTTNKYAAARTLTVVDTPTMIGPKATALALSPPGDETIIATVGVAAIASGTNLTFEIEVVGVA